MPRLAGQRRRLQRVFHFLLPPQHVGTPVQRFGQPAVGAIPERFVLRAAPQPFQRVDRVLVQRTGLLVAPPLQRLRRGPQRLLGMGSERATLQRFGLANHLDGPFQPPDFGGRRRRRRHGLDLGHRRFRDRFFNGGDLRHRRFLGSRLFLHRLLGHRFLGHRLLGQQLIQQLFLGKRRFFRGRLLSRRFLGHRLFQRRLLGQELVEEVVFQQLRLFGGGFCRRGLLHRSFLGRFLGRGFLGQQVVERGFFDGGGFLRRHIVERRFLGDRGFLDRRFLGHGLFGRRFLGGCFLAQQFQKHVVFGQRGLIDGRGRGGRFGRRPGRLIQLRLAQCLGSQFLDALALRDALFRRDVQHGLFGGQVFRGRLLLQQEILERGFGHLLGHGLVQNDVLVHRLLDGGHLRLFAERLLGQSLHAGIRRLLELRRRAFHRLFVQQQILKPGVVLQLAGRVVFAGRRQLFFRLQLAARRFLEEHFLGNQQTVFVQLLRRRGSDATREGHQEKGQNPT